MLKLNLWIIFSVSDIHIHISKDSFFHSHGLLACLFLHEKMLRWYQSLLCSYLVTPIIIEKLAETEIWRPRSCKLVVPRGWMTIWKKKIVRRQMACKYCSFHTGCRVAVTVDRRAAKRVINADLLDSAIIFCCLELFFVIYSKIS